MPGMASLPSDNAGSSACKHGRRAARFSRCSCSLLRDWLCIELFCQSTCLSFNDRERLPHAEKCHRLSVVPEQGTLIAASGCVALLVWARFSLPFRRIGKHIQKLKLASCHTNECLRLHASPLFQNSLGVLICSSISSTSFSARFATRNAAWFLFLRQ